MEESKALPDPAQPARPRHAWIDYAKGITIIIIVLGHIASGFNKVQHNGVPLKISQVPLEILHIMYYAPKPLFFFVAGIFIRKAFLSRGLKTFINYKFQTIFWPYLVWATIQVTMQYIGYRHGGSNTVRYLTDYLYILYLPDRLNQFWFLYVLFAVSIIAALLLYYLKLSKPLLVLVGFCTYFISYYLPPEGGLFGVTFICKSLFYLSLGDYLSATLLDRDNFAKFSSFWTTLILVAVFGLLKYLVHVFGIVESEQYFFSASNAFAFVSAITGLFLILNVSFILDRFNVLKWLKEVGKRSLYIYAIHVIISGIARFLILKLTGYQYPDLSLFIVTFLAVWLPIILYKLMNRYGLWFFFSPVKPKRDGVLET